MSKKFDYNDINLIPKCGIVSSRSECNTSITLGKYNFKNPAIPANMESVVDEDLCIKLASDGYFYIMHRFDVDSLSFTKKMHDKNLIASISVGVNNESYELIDSFVNEGITPEYICIDVAHGHSLKLKKMLKYIKSNLPDTFTIAGNISTTEATHDLTRWGADALKVGVAPGSACTTAMATGFGSRNCQASVVHECSSVSSIPIIADGGIKHPADITKAIVLGADMCMVGGMMSSFTDSPGREVEQDGIIYKEFYGSASAKQSNKTNRIEGTTKLNKMKNNTLLEYQQYLNECIQSSISYGGGTQLKDLKTVKWF